MARGSKSTFSFFGRRSSSLAQDGGGRQETRPQNAVALQYNSMAGLSKAERILGTTGLPKQELSSLRLHRHVSSFADSTPFSDSEPSPSLASSHDDAEETAPTTVPPRNNFPPRKQSLLNRPTPTLQDDGAASMHHAASTRRKPSDTLKPYYDAAAHPPNISQQTSESAIRDRALRKGMQPVVSSPAPTGFHASPDFDDFELCSRHQALPQRTRQLHSAQQIYKSRPQAADANMFDANEFARSPAQSASSYTRPYDEELSALPPLDHRNAYSPTCDTMADDPPNMYASHTGKLAGPSSHSSSLHAMYENPKVHVNRPRRHRENWFDGLSDEDEEDEADVYAHQQAEVMSPGVGSGNDLPYGTEPQENLSHIHGAAAVDRTIAPDDELHMEESSAHEIAQVFLSNPLDASTPPQVDQIADSVRSPPEAKSEQSYVPAFADQNLNLAHCPSSLEIAAVDDSQTFHDHNAQADLLRQEAAGSSHAKGLSLQSHETSASIPLTTSKSSRLADAGLRTSSALSLSSSLASDDEVTHNENPVRNMRDSIAASEYGLTAEGVQIGKARAFNVRAVPAVGLRSLSDLQEMPSTPSVQAGNTDTQGAKDVDPELAEVVSPVNDALAEAGQLDYTSHSRVELVEHDAGRLEAAETSMTPDMLRDTSVAIARSRGHTKNVKSLSLRSSHGSSSSQVIATQRFMAVSAEEEALLEMIRTKRAVMSQGSDHGSGDQTDNLLADASARGALKAVLDSGIGSDESPAPEARDDKAVADDDEQRPSSSDSRLTDIMEAFPSPSPSQNRFSASFIKTRSVPDTGVSPGLSTAGSSTRQNKDPVKRSSVISHATASLHAQSTPGTSTSSVTSKHAETDKEDIDKKPAGWEIGKDQSTAPTLSMPQTTAHVFDRSVAVLSLQPVAMTAASTSLLDVPRSSPNAPAAQSVAPSARLGVPRSAPWALERHASEEVIVAADHDVIAGSDTILGSAALYSRFSEQRHKNTSSTELPRHARVTARQSQPSLHRLLFANAPTEQEKTWAKRRRSMRINVSNTPPSALPLGHAPEMPRGTLQPLDPSSLPDLLNQPPIAPSTRPASLYMSAVDLRQTPSPSPSDTLPPPSPLHISPTRSSRKTKRTNAEYRLTPDVRTSSMQNLPLRPTSPSFYVNDFYNYAGGSTSVIMPSKLQQTLIGDSESDLAAPAPILGRVSSSSYTTEKIYTSPTTKSRVLQLTGVKKIFTAQKNANAEPAGLPTTSPSPQKSIKRRRLSLLSIRSTSSNVPSEATPALDRPHSNDTDSGSVSEDVLAAWTSLGGWSGAYTVAAN